MFLFQNVVAFYFPTAPIHVSPLLLLSVVSHCALLPRRSCWSPERDCYPTAPSLLCH